MTTSIIRRAIPLTVAAMISLAAMLATASQAGAATYYACVKKSGAAHVYAKKPKCKRGESKLSWNSAGVPGRNGVNGKNGSNGATGKEGSGGKEGQPGPFGEVLPSGRSETGVYALEGDGSVIQSAWAFPVALATAPTSHFIPDGTPPPSQCPGSLSNPRASAGHLCVYEGTSHGGTISAKKIFNPESETFETSSRFGFAFDIDNTKLGSNAWSQGTWAVTAG